MVPELGQFALVLALCFACIQGFAPLLKKYTLQLSYDVVFGQFVFFNLCDGMFDHQFCQ